MKLVLGAALAALLLATPALAQTDPAPAAVNATACGAIAPAPALPDGATADREEMEAGNAAFVAWAEANRMVLTCRRAEVQALEARFHALRDEYNAGAQQLNTANASWEADVNEFNDRGGTRRR